MLALALAGTAQAHRSGCHAAHSCPSDHHTYVWYDASGAGHDCAEPGAPEDAPGTDTEVLAYAGLTYHCRPVGAVQPQLPPPPVAPPVVSRCTLQGTLPDRACTPGTVFAAATRAAVCRPGYSGRVRHVTAATRADVFAEYGITSRLPGEYEVDHLIPLELGGSNAVANLFPQPATPLPGFHEKDELENALHARVCAGRTSLAAAQRAIATDWVAAYRRYVTRAVRDGA